MPSVESLPAPDLTAPGEDKWRREQRAFHRLIPDLLLSHRGLFVAVHEGCVVESGDDKVKVAQRAYNRFGYVPIFVSRVVEYPAPTVRIPSPRRAGDAPVA